MTEPVAAAEALASELLLLLDALPAALRRDAGNSQPGPRATEASIPVNQDVAEVMRVLPRQVAAEDRRIRTALGFSKISQGTPDVISRWPSYVRALQACTTAGDYSTDTAITALTRWLKAVRRALGLSMRAQPLGIHTCPYSCPEGQLLVLGSEGSLRRQGTGWGVDWRHAERILCPACGTSWGQAEWPLLGKLLNAATRTEADPVALGIMLGIPAATIRRWAFEKRIVSTGTDQRGRTLYATDAVRAVAVDLGRLAALPRGKFAITERVVNTHQQWNSHVPRKRPGATPGRFLHARTGQNTRRKAGVNRNVPRPAHRAGG